MTRFGDFAAVGEHDLALFNDSLELCLAQPRFLDRFYEVFLASSPEVAEAFRNTEFKPQTRALRRSLLLLLFAAQGFPEGEVHLKRLAESHGPRGRNFPQHLYDLWLRSLLQVAAETDPGFSPEVERAWIAVLQPGIEMLRAGARP